MPKKLVAPPIQKESTEMQTQDEGDSIFQYEIFKVNKDDLIELINTNISGGMINPLRLDRIRVPVAGQTSFLVHTAEDITAVKELHGIILFAKTGRNYWQKKYGEGEKTPPDCQSEDGVRGFGNRGVHGEGWQDCSTCELNRPAPNGGAKPCREHIALFTLMPDELLPVIIIAPPTSIRPVEEYFYRLTRKFLMYNHVETIFRLDKQKVGNFDVAVLNLSLSPGRLDGDAIDRIKALASVIVPSLKKAQLQPEVESEDEDEDENKDNNVIWVEGIKDNNVIWVDNNAKKIAFEVEGGGEGVEGGGELEQDQNVATNE